MNAAYALACYQLGLCDADEVGSISSSEGGVGRGSFTMTNAPGSAIAAEGQFGSVRGILTDPVLATLDTKIDRLVADITAVTPTSEAMVLVFVQANALLVRWAPFYGSHKNDIFADPTVRGEFNGFVQEYNELLANWKALGGRTAQTPQDDIEADIDKSADSLIGKLGWVKWLAIAGLGAYVLDRTGAFDALKSEVGRRSARA